MFQSKPLKKLPKKLQPTKQSDNKVISLFYRVQRMILESVYWPIESFFRTFKERFFRSLDWARFAWLNYDFDSVYLYDVMEFKLKRLLHCLENCISWQDKKDLDALRELIVICGRLRRCDYDDKYLALHDKKWGRLPRIMSKNRLRSKVKTEEDKENERKEFLACFDKGEKDRKADIDRMAKILKKYSCTWWD